MTKLSKLQKYILIEIYNHNNIYKKEKLLKFYKNKKNKPDKKDQHNNITKSIERLIDRGLMIGYGRRTPKKWFMEKVELTTKGKTATEKILSSNQKKLF